MAKRWRGHVAWPMWSYMGCTIKRETHQGGAYSNLAREATYGPHLQSIWASPLPNLAGDGEEN